MHHHLVAKNKKQVPKLDLHKFSKEPLRVNMTISNQVEVKNNEMNHKRQVIDYNQQIVIPPQSYKEIWR